MTLTIADIDRAEQAVAHVNRTIDGLARAVYQVRNGGCEIDGGKYQFQYYRREFDDDDGTPIFSVWYLWLGADHSINVDFPQDYLKSNWRQVEEARLAEEQAIIERERLEFTEAGERQERATYERLKRKYENHG